MKRPILRQSLKFWIMAYLDMSKMQQMIFFDKYDWGSEICNGINSSISVLHISQTVA